MEEQRVALVTGANRGMGLETCRQLGRLGYKIILTARDEPAGEEAAAGLRDQGLDVEFRRLDVTNHDEIRPLVADLQDNPGRIDVLVANAGIFPEGDAAELPNLVSALDVDMETVRLTLETNTLGHMTFYQAVIPVMQAQGYGRIAILSSELGRINDMTGSAPGYRMSHIANNALARIFAAETKDDNIKVNAVCPDWVKTRMGGPKAPLEVEEGVETTVWLATLPDDGPSGGFFRFKQQLEW